MAKTIEFIFSSEGKETKIHMDEPTETEVLQLIHCAFNFLESEITDKSEGENTLRNLYASFSEMHKIGAATESNEKVYTCDDSTNGTIKETEPVMTVPQLTERDILPDGVRVFNGVLTYRTSYNCPKCRHKGGRYLSGKHQTANCHNCGYRIPIDYAVGKGPDKLPLPNEYNIFFVSK